MGETAIKNVVVIGAGVMGAGIAQVLAIAGCKVTACDISEEVLAKSKEDTANGRFGIQSAVQRGKLTEAEATESLNRLAFSANSDDAVAKADLIIEAIPERFSSKIQLFKDLDKSAPPSCIFASNSSGFSISALAAATERPELVIGWHWASPAPVMKLAEIVKGRETSEETIEKICELAAAAGKNPIVVKDLEQNWGYVTNRVYFAMVAEANKVVQDGIATREEVDQLMVDCFRWPVGPFGMTTGATGGWQKTQSTEKS